MNRILLAQALGFAPAGTVFRDVVTAANKFGLIKGNYNSETLELTPLGELAARARSSEESLNALRQAMDKIPLFAKLLRHYNNNKLPGTDLLKSILERPPFSVPSAWSKEAADVFIATGRLTGVIRDVSGSPYVILAAGAPVEVETEPAGEPTIDSIEEPASQIEQPPQPGSTGTPATQPSTQQFFIAHGRDRTALSQLQSILKGLDIPYMVAEEEPNIGRPISQKIADLMRSCSAGIFIFSADEEVRDADGGTVKRPRPNVVYELGAASFQYGQRIVIFKEHGVEFPTDFRDLGYIEFEKDHLAEKSMELLRELVKLRAVRVVAGSAG
jgi:predicted nucleotide-binding protein